MKLKYGIFLLILAGTVQAEPYEWMNNPMLNGGHTQKYEAPYRAYKTPNKYTNEGFIIKDNRGNTWWEEPNKYTNEGTIIRKVH